jgi:ABC-type lipoprotein export system ATPase subunit
MLVPRAEVSAERTTAIIGGTGSGKTTLVNLIPHEQVVEAAKATYVDRFAQALEEVV